MYKYTVHKILIAHNVYGCLSRHRNIVKRCLENWLREIGHEKNKTSSPKILIINLSIINNLDDRNRFIRTICLLLDSSKN